MRPLLHLAAILTITIATTSHAQITNPDKLVAPPPANPARPTTAVKEDLQWLWKYAQPSPTGDKPKLLADPRFKTLLQTSLKAPQAFWSIPGTPLSDAARTFLEGPGQVASDDNRHLTVRGAVLAQPEQTGELWIDLGAPKPLVVFVALRWNESALTPDQPGAPFTLWIFPSRELDPHHLPQALQQSIGHLSSNATCKPINIQSAVVVDPNGIPHIVGPLEVGATGICFQHTGTHS